jgi:hypothetical protein
MGRIDAGRKQAPWRISTMLFLAHSNNASRVEMVTHETSDLRPTQSREAVTLQAPRDAMLRQSRTGSVAATETNMQVQRNQPFGSFDLNRDVVEGAAIKVYARGHKDAYDLLMVDL